MGSSVHRDLSRLGCLADGQGDDQHAIGELGAELVLVDRRIEPKAEGVAEVAEFAMKRLPGAGGRFATGRFNGEDVLIKTDGHSILGDAGQLDLDGVSLIRRAGGVARLAQRRLIGSRCGGGGGGWSAAGSHGVFQRVQGWWLGLVHFDRARLAVLLLGQRDRQETVLELG